MIKEKWLCIVLIQSSISIDLQNNCVYTTRDQYRLQWIVEYYNVCASVHNNIRFKLTNIYCPTFWRLERATITASLVSIVELRWNFCLLFVAADFFFSPSLRTPSISIVHFRFILHWTRNYWIVGASQHHSRQTQIPMGNEILIIF